MTLGSRAGASSNTAAGWYVQETMRICDGGQNIADEHQSAGQHAQHGDSGISTIALTFLGLLGVMRGIVAQCKPAKQGWQVICQHLGGDIDNQSLLTQTKTPAKQLGSLGQATTRHPAPNTPTHASTSPARRYRHGEHGHAKSTRSQVSKAQTTADRYWRRRACGDTREWQVSAPASAATNRAPRQCLTMQSAYVRPITESLSEFSAGVCMCEQLGKGSVRYATNHFGAAAAYAGVTTGEEGNKKGLLGACGHRQQCCNERWQWQLAVSGKGIGKTGMLLPVGEMHPSQSDQTNPA